MVSPLPFLAIGLLAASGVAFFVVIGHILKKRMTARTAELLRKGASPEQAFRQLIAEGYDPELSAKVVEKTIRRSQVERASGLLEKGLSAQEAQKALMSTGLDVGRAEQIAREAAFFRTCRRWRFVLLPAGVLLLFAGAAVILLGMLLRSGNTSGKFVTFPFAGGLTILLGTMILVVGLVMLSGVFRVLV